MSGFTPTTASNGSRPLWAVFKLRAVWINVNYRYVKDELHYLLTNADLKALVHQREFSPWSARCCPTCPTCATSS